MIVLGCDERLSRAVPEHERVERGEHQTRRRIVRRPLVEVALSAAGVECPARPGDRQRGPLREVGRIAGAVARAVASTKDRERLVPVNGGRRVGSMEEAVDVGDDQALRREPRNERVDRSLLKRWMTAVRECAKQRRSVTRALGAELNDIAAHRVDLLADAEALEARAERARVALG